MIKAYTLFLVPDSPIIKVLAAGAKVEEKYELVTPQTEHVAKFCPEGLAVAYYVAPPPADNPSAFFSVRYPDHQLTEPNMEYQELVVQHTTGVALSFKADDAVEKCRQLASVAEQSEVVLGFKIRILVNNEDLFAGNILTKPGALAAKVAPKGRGPIRISDVHKNIKKARNE